MDQHLSLLTTTTSTPRPSPSSHWYWSHCWWRWWRSRWWSSRWWWWWGWWWLPSWLLYNYKGKISEEFQLKLLSSSDDSHLDKTFHFSIARQKFMSAQILEVNSDHMWHGSFIRGVWEFQYCWGIFSPRYILSDHNKWEQFKEICITFMKVMRNMVVGCLTSLAHKYNEKFNEKIMRNMTMGLVRYID